jgi:hypothetical protein
MGKLSYSTRLFGQFVGFARENKAYWIVPLVLVMGLMAAAIVGTNAAAPLIYAIF